MAAYIDELCEVCRAGRLLGVDRKFSKSQTVWITNELLETLNIMALSQAERSKLYGSMEDIWKSFNLCGSATASVRKKIIYNEGERHFEKAFYCII